MARLTSAEYEKTKQKLLIVGLKSFELKGYNATGLKELATDAGISKGSFYSYFSSKEAFGVAVIQFYSERSLNTWRSMLDESIKTEDACTALISTFVKIIDKYKKIEKKKGCLVGTLASEISEASEACRIALKSSVNLYIELLMEYIELGQSQGVIRNDLESKRLAGLIWDSWQGSLLRMKIEKSVEPIINDLTLLFETVLLPQIEGTLDV